LTKILNIITDTNIGGAGKVLLNFMRKTDRDEFDHTVVVPEKAALSPLLRALDIRVVEMPGIADRSFSPGATGAFRRIFRQIGPDLIHTHASLSARIAAKTGRGRYAVVHTLHCTYPQSRLKTSFPVKQALGFVNNHLSDIMIAISPAARDNLVETGADPRKIITMFNGVEPVRRISNEEKSIVKKLMGIEDGMFVCAVIARLVPEKGHLYVLEAADILRDLPIRFVMAGAGPSEDELRAAVAGRDLTNCVFTGFVDDIAVIENIMDLQLNASYGTETSSLSLLEGMSLEVPAVASDFGGNPYLIAHGENGLLVAKKDGAALAGAVRELFEDPEKLAAMGKNAYRVYSERFTAEIMAAGIEQAYRTALRAAN